MKQNLSKANRDIVKGEPNGQEEVKEKGQEERQEKRQKEEVKSSARHIGCRIR